MKRTIELNVPPDFRLKTVAFSHGWFDLPPFGWSVETGILNTVVRLGNAIAAIAISQNSKSLRIEVEVSGRWTQSRQRVLLDAVSPMLGLGIDVAEFYRTAGKRYHWAKRLGAGRMLRGGSVFEDAVKMLATTNCSWSLTRIMVGRLVEELGEPAGDGRGAFPTPQAMAGQRPKFYRDRIRAGYRSEYLRDFARQVSDGEIDPESWAAFAGPTDELLGQMRQVRGIGRYAAENLCKLLGRFDGLGLDSWCIRKFPEIHGPVQGDVAAAIRAHYEPFGRYQGLALWLDLTRDWHEKNALADKTTVFAKEQ